VSGAVYNQLVLLDGIQIVLTIEMAIFLPHRSAKELTNKTPMKAAA
jgi:hypothetical protein